MYGEEYETTEERAADLCELLAETLVDEIMEILGEEESDNALPYPRSLGMLCTTRLRNIANFYHTISHGALNVAPLLEVIDINSNNTPSMMELARTVEELAAGRGLEALKLFNRARRRAGKSTNIYWDDFSKEVEDFVATPEYASYIETLNRDISVDDIFPLSEKEKRGGWQYMPCM